MKLVWKVLLLTGISVQILLWGMGLLLPLAPEPIGSHADLFLEGTRRTLELTGVAGSLGLGMGLIFGLGKISSWTGIRLFCSGWVGFLRGTPLLVQIFLIYYAVPAVFPALRLNEFWAAAIALALNVGAYNAEAVRSAVLAIPRGQWEASVSLGFSSWQTLRWVVLPQASKIMLPPLVNNGVALLKDSSLASSIGLLELSLVGHRVTSETFLPVPVLVTVATLYLFQSLVVSTAAHWIERRIQSL